MIRHRLATISLLALCLGTFTFPATASSSVTYGSLTFWKCVFSWTCFANTVYERIWNRRCGGGAITQGADITIVKDDSNSGVNARTDALLGLLAAAAARGQYLESTESNMTTLANACASGYGTSDIRNLVNSFSTGSSSTSDKCFSTSSIDSSSSSSETTTSTSDESSDSSSNDTSSESASSDTSNDSSSDSTDYGNLIKLTYE